jgi:hypothetical protein
MQGTVQGIDMMRGSAVIGVRTKFLHKLMKGSVHENVILAQAAVHFLVGQPWRNKHGKASPLAWFVLRGARVKPESGPSCQQPLTSKLWLYGGH